MLAMFIQRGNNVLANTRDGGVVVKCGFLLLTPSLPVAHDMSSKGVNQKSKHFASVSKSIKF